ncbi:unnamed protein product [Owenia fusiformis]|uniref:Uncharacterized protein n=1 Tax=Owenia fusiformis TaxID=6347 RepID=A0A8J1UNU2_OWEFU|nr:unnamed protein product [Owenia fusiformis]
MYRKYRNIVRIRILNMQTHSDGIENTLKEKLSRSITSIQEETSEENPVPDSSEVTNRDEKESGNDAANDDDDDAENNDPDGEPAKKGKKLSDEELLEIQDKIIEEIVNVRIPLLKEITSADPVELDKHFRNAVLFIAQAYFKFNKHGILRTRPYKIRLDDTLASNGLLAYYLKALHHLKEEGHAYLGEGGAILQDKPFCNITKTLINCSDTGDSFCRHVCEVDGFLDFLVDFLRNHLKGHIEKTNKESVETGIRNIVGCLHNVSVRSENRQVLKDHGVVEIVLEYSEQSPKERIRLSTLFTLSFTLDESQSHLFASNPKQIKLLLSYLSQAMESKIRRHKGYSAVELAQAVSQLSINDGNKKLIFEQDALPLLLHLAKGNKENEQIEATKAIWMLAFDEDNQTKMKNNSELIELLETLKGHNNKEVRNNAKGALWTLKEKSEQHKIQTEAESGVKESEVKHIMISYNWGHQKLVKRINQELKSLGYKIWLDIEQMEGSTLGAMAAAVEGACVIIVCMSQKYKDSPNCRAEAEYAYNLQKPIVPLLMEKGYRADGWLGMLLGTKLFFNFSGKYPFEDKMRELIKELGNQGKGQSVDQTDVAQSLPMSMSSLPAPSVPKKVESGAQTWDNAQVKDWLKKIGLENDNLNNVSGKELMFLRGLRSEAPEFFFSYLNNKLNISGLYDLQVFTDALRQL